MFFELPQGVFSHKKIDIGQKKMLQKINNNLFHFGLYWNLFSSQKAKNVSQIPSLTICTKHSQLQLQAISIYDIIRLAGHCCQHGGACQTIQSPSFGDPKGQRLPG